MDDRVSEEGGFVAGTLVHTDKGVVPIEKIKFGDMVLSKPGDGTGEVAYKPVVKTFEFEDQEIWFSSVGNIYCYRDDQFDDGSVPYVNEDIVGTPNHLFWVIGELDFSRGMLVADPKVNHYPKGRWVRLDQLKIGSVVLLASGLMASIMSVQPVLETKNPDFGFIQGHGFDRWWDEPDGSYIDLSNGLKFHLLSEKFINDYDGEEGDEWSAPVMKRKVYNFEVADCYTYFVGDGGVWVNNKDFGKIS